MLRSSDDDTLDVDDAGRTATLGPLPPPRGTVAVVAAGTSDGPVAAEAATTVRVHGASVLRIDDVGVAGLHRLLAVRDDIDTADALVVVAGMEGALPSVVGGLTGVPLVAVPTSIGYGASFGGIAALLAMLNSCAPGVVVVNIDNGYGAGVHAARIARQSRPGCRGRRRQRIGAGMTVAWLDVRAGASGDMLLGALLDAGADLDAVRTAVAAVGVEPVGITVSRTTRGGIAATRVDVAVPDAVAHRTWHDLRGLLVRASLPEPVRERALDVFSRIARAEGIAHGVDAESVHFHEVGALDAIADVVGVCAAVESLGITAASASPVALGTGIVPDVARPPRGAGACGGRPAQRRRRTDVRR